MKKINSILAKASTGRKRLSFCTGFHPFGSCNDSEFIEVFIDFFFFFDLKLSISAFFSNPPSAEDHEFILCSLSHSLYYA